MSSESTKKDENFKELSKYFIHGFAFSAIMVVLLITWVFIFVFLIVLGSFIGIVIGFVLFFFILGGLNGFLTKNIWSISVKTGWMSLLGHGFVLFIFLIIAHIPSMFIYLTFPSLTWEILLFEAFIDGFVAKNIANWWKEEKIDLGTQYPIASQHETIVGARETMKYCPNCGRRIPKGFKVCPHCVLNVKRE
jgi:hypothetical protein